MKTEGVVSEEVCPNCKSSDIWIEEYEQENNHLFQPCGCNECEATWTNEYNVVYNMYSGLEVPELKKPEPEQPQIGAKVLGYWVASVTDNESSEIQKWGKDGDTTMPFTLKSAALECAKDLRLHNCNPIYILTLFDNGQMLTEVDV